MQNKHNGKNHFVFRRSNIIECRTFPFTEYKSTFSADILVDLTALCRVGPIGNDAASTDLSIVLTFFVNTSNIDDTRLWSSESHVHILRDGWRIV